MGMWLSQRFSLSSKAAIAFAVGLVGVSLLGAWWQYHITSRTLTDEWETKGAEIGRTVAFTISPLLAKHDLEAIEQVVRQTNLIPEVHSVTILDAEGAILADSASRPVGSLFPFHTDQLRDAIVQKKIEVSWVERTGQSRTQYTLIPIHMMSSHTTGPAQTHGATLVGLDLTRMDVHLSWSLKLLFAANAVTVLITVALFWVAVRVGVVRPLKQLTSSLSEIEAFDHAVLASFPGHVAVMDKTGMVLAVNRPWDYSPLSTDSSEIVIPQVGLNFLDRCHQASESDQGSPYPAAAVAEGLHRVVNGSATPLGLTFAAPGHQPPLWLMLTAAPLGRPEGGIILAHVEVTALKAHELHVAETACEQDQSLTSRQSLYANLPVGLLSVNPHGFIEQATPLAATHLGTTRQALIGRRPADVLPPDRWTKLAAVFNQVMQAGTPHSGIEDERPDPNDAEHTCTLVYDLFPKKDETGAGQGLHILVHDVTATRQAHKQLESRLRDLEAKNRELDQMAIRDPLTGLYNRRFFDEGLGREWRRFQRTGKAFTVIITDFDNFKTINDQFGHDAGDQALRQVAIALHQTLRETDLLARIGGDEFAAVLPGADPEHSSAVVAKLHEALRRITLPTVQGLIPISVSLGYATVPGTPPVTSASELLRVADKRMYEAKRLSSAGKAHSR